MVFSARFADIFRGNALGGLLAAVLDQASIERLWELIQAEPGIAATVNLIDRVVSCGPFSAPFEVDEYAGWRLLEGLDDIGLTLCHEAEIDAAEACRPAILPTVTPS